MRDEAANVPHNAANAMAGERAKRADGGQVADRTRQETALGSLVEFRTQAVDAAGDPPHKCSAAAHVREWPFSLFRSIPRYVILRLGVWGAEFLPDGARVEFVSEDDATRNGHSTAHVCDAHLASHRVDDEHLRRRPGDITHRGQAADLAAESGYRGQRCSSRAEPIDPPLDALVDAGLVPTRVARVDGARNETARSPRYPSRDCQKATHRGQRVPIIIVVVCVGLRGGRNFSLTRLVVRDEDVVHAVELPRREGEDADDLSVLLGDGGSAHIAPWLGPHWLLSCQHSSRLPAFSSGQMRAAPAPTVRGGARCGVLTVRRTLSRRRGPCVRELAASRSSVSLVPCLTTSRIA